jgi:hypothetical protein
MCSYNEEPSDSLEPLAQVFRDQLEACLAECSQGRRGLFCERVDGEPWLEAAQLRQLALALQQLFAQDERENPLVAEFLDLCTIHGESDPGEARLARAFMKRIEKGEVGTQPEGERRPW